MITIGIDIGTTTISAVVVENQTNMVLQSLTIPNDSNLSVKQGCQHLQDPNIILDYVCSVIENLTKKYDVTRIGVTGQMHGILYLNKDGNPVSPLYTWQNSLGNSLYQYDLTYCDYIEKQTGYIVASGFGCATHFYCQNKNQIPNNAACFCTIGDYVAMRLANVTQPIMHVSNAASLGLYDIQQNYFDKKAINLLGIDETYFPRIKKGYHVLGKTESGIMVSLAIGDNQASFLGAVDDIERDVLVNIGTGGQISCHSKYFVSSDLFETRPFMENTYLLVASSLCGGRAYAALERFFRLTLEMVGIERSSVYEDMGKLMEEAMIDNPLEVQTLFCGTRKQPDKRGEISNIDLTNLTPQQMIHGFMIGIAQELYPPYKEFCKQKKFTAIMASGNTVRKNKYFQQALSTVYSLPLKVTDFTEEAAYGAALYSMSTH
ncbi:MAG: hypothetical protein K0R90_153 [Oscillospiraceae bacterium]|nr:hypothetical protein [Oscillospiraceae bacterium]